MPIKELFNSNMIHAETLLAWDIRQAFMGNWSSSDNLKHEWVLVRQREKALQADAIACVKFLDSDWAWC